MLDFDARVREATGGVLAARELAVLQLNVGLRCNLVCRHCHLGCSPTRSEQMERGVMERVVALAGELRPELIDITGGAPELNPELPWLIEALHALGLSLQVRTNLAALLEPPGEALLELLRDRGVTLVGSLPCYTPENVDAQRGAGAYERSVAALRRLNALGYGRPGGPALHLVYNPGGPFLPGEQRALEADYRRELAARCGVVFTSLLTLTNMPLGRFGEQLRAASRIEDYLGLLERSFNPENLEGLMCRRQLSIAWNGTLYDCDFNLALGLPVDHGAPDHIRHWDTELLARRRIVTGEHCFGCAAGRGSSCGGALSCR
jgi:radical SAM/Cys-rich protein